MLRELQKKQISKFLNIDNVPFKILVLDDGTRDILAPLFKLSELRNSGICAHFLISNSRSSAKDIPVVYYVKDFTQVAMDVNKLLYSNYYLNSATQIKRPELENLALKVGEMGHALRIKSINDTFTDFISLQKDLFTLNLRNSYRNDYTREIVSGLFSVFVTMDKNPFIVGNLHATGLKNNILKMLESKIKNTKMIKSSVKKPLLILVDRDIDLVNPLMHNLQFVELVDDMFPIGLNKIDLGENSVNLDTDSEIFNKQRFEDFVEVVDIINAEVLSNKKEMALKNVNAADVAKMLEVAPELQKKTEIVNNLLNISIKVVNEIKKRKIDEFYSMETNFVKDDLMTLSDNGTREDVIRLCVSFLGTPHAQFIEPLLEKRNIQTRVVEYIKRFLADESGYSSLIKNKMKNFLFKKSNPLVSYIEDILFKIKNSNLDEFYETSFHAGPVYYNEISEIVVFVNGGTTYTELRNLKELEDKIKIPIVLGGSEMTNATQLMEQIEQCE